MEKEIREIIEDTKYWQPDMIIERKEPFFWRMSRDWVDDKVKRIMRVIDKD